MKFEIKHGMRLFIVQLLVIVGFSSCSSEAEKIHPTQKSITTSVYSSVIIQPDSLYKAYAMVNGILEKNLVEENTIVSEGTPIIQIINTSALITAENAKLAYNLAQQNYSGKAAILNSLSKELSNTKLKLNNDSINYFRQKNLWEQNIGAKAEYDAKKLAFDLSSNAFAIAKENYSRTKNELRTQMNQANNSYKNTIISTNDFTIISKITGKVYALYKNPGEIVTTLEPIASIGSAHTFIIEMLVDEVDIVKIEIGQKVLITLDAFGYEVFTAKVSKIYPIKDEYNQTFLVEARFEEGPIKLYPGLSGEGNIIINTKENTLTIPRDYLAEGNKVKTDEGLINVAIGLQNIDNVEILSGITKETWIYKPE